MFYLINIHASKMGIRMMMVSYIFSGTKLIRLKRLLLIIGNIEQKEENLALSTSAIAANHEARAYPMLIIILGQLACQSQHSMALTMHKLAYLVTGQD